jgi:hypothetical protein
VDRVGVAQAQQTQGKMALHRDQWGLEDHLLALLLQLHNLLPLVEIIVVFHKIETPRQVMHTLLGRQTVMEDWV